MLERLFDRITWDASAHRTFSTTDRMHGPGCECNPDSALKIQCALINTIRVRCECARVHSHAE